MSNPPRAPIDVQLRPAHARGFAAILTLCGEHDVATSEGIRVALEPLYGNVLVDLSECEFIDSSVIAALLTNSEQRQREGHHLELVVPRANVTITRIIDISGLRDVLVVYPSIADA